MDLGQNDVALAAGLEGSPGLGVLEEFDDVSLT